MEPARPEELERGAELDRLKVGDLEERQKANYAALEAVDRAARRAEAQPGRGATGPALMLQGDFFIEVRDDDATRAEIRRDVAAVDELLRGLRAELDAKERALARASGQPGGHQ